MGQTLDAFGDQRRGDRLAGYPAMSMRGDLKRKLPRHWKDEV